MECDICCREYDSKRLPFLCPVDARNQLYESRFQHLRLALERDELGEQIDSLLASSGSIPVQQPDGGQDAVDAARASQRRAETRTSHILAAADQLRSEIEAARDEIKARKAALARRRSDLASLSNGLPERRDRQARDTEKSVQRIRYRWAQGAEEMAGCRSFLCTEAAYLYGMDRVRAVADVGSGGGGGGGAGSSWEYRIGKVPVIELRDMNSLSPELITTSLGHISHVLMLASHYLSIRLPAEITLPHRNYPLATIFHLASSYRHPTVSFPDTASSAGTSAATAPETPVKDSNGQRLPRPRPLYIHKPLPQLLKDDPSAYSYFIEAVSLLAYDIAWLCSTQGMTFGEKHTFDEVCQMGRNLHTLLIESYPGSGDGDGDGPKYEDKGSEAPPASSPAGGATGDAHNERNWIGRYSHGTTFYHLGGADGTDLVRSFKLPNPSRIADKLRKKLIGDAPIPDWEILEDDAWKVEEGEVFAEPKSSPPSSAAEALRNYRWSKLRS